MLKAMAASVGARVAVLPVAAVASALTTYLVVGYAGAIEFGFISLIGTLFLLIPFADLGLGAAIVNSVATEIDSEKEAARGLTRAAFMALVVSGASLALIATMLAASGVLGAMVGLPESARAVGSYAVLVALLPFAVSLPLGVGQRVLLGLGKNHLVNLYGAAAPLSALLLTWVLVGARVDPLFLAVASPAGVLVAALLAFIIALRQTGWASAFFDRPRGGIDRRQLWSAALPMMVISIAVPAGLQGGRLVLSHAGTPAQLSEYAMAFQFYIPAFSVAAAAGAVLWPLFARSRSSNRIAMVRALRAMGCVGVAIAIPFGLLIDPVAVLISQGAIRVSSGLAWSLALLLFVMSIHQVSGTLLTTPSQLVFQAPCSVAMAAATIAGGVFLAPLAGAAGVALAAAAAVTLFQLIPCMVLAWKVVTRS